MVLSWGVQDKGFLQQRENLNIIVREPIITPGFSSSPIKGEKIM
jgi:hypothetical protein